MCSAFKRPRVSVPPTLGIDRSRRTTSGRARAAASNQATPIVNAPDDLEAVLEEFSDTLGKQLVVVDNQNAREGHVGSPIASASMLMRSISTGS